MTTYRRIPHAAHYGNGLGHDVEQWDVTAPTLEEAQAKRYGIVPRDAEYHSGYRTRDGEQHWLFVRTAALTPGGCPRCP